MTVPIDINFNEIIKKNVPIPGFNVNPYADSDALRPPGSRTLKETFAMLKPGCIRPSNGYMADLILWAQSPDWNPKTSMSPAVYGWDYWASNDKRIYTTPPNPGGTFINTLNFSDFNYVKPEKTTFLIAVPLLGAYVVNKLGDPVEKAKLLETACQWVKYCLDHKIPVCYWEISNESTMSSNDVATISPEQYANDVVTWAKAMKKIDPTIKIAANGETAKDFKVVMDIAGGYIDALVPHCYGPWGYKSYAQYALDSPKFTYNLDLCYEGLALSKNKKDVDIVISETNIIDYKKVLTPANDTGKALMIFDLLGQLISAKRTSCVCFWEDRAFNEGKDGFPKLLRQNNRLQPAGFAFYMWTNFLPKGASMVTTPKISGLVIFAATSATRDVVWVSNKTTKAIPITVTTNSNKPVKETYVFKGKSYTDTLPVLNKISSPTVAAPTSITIFMFRK
jgi:hypothetical protein